jgi:hypothetical protein
VQSPHLPRCAHWCPFDQLVGRAALLVVCACTATSASAQQRAHITVRTYNTYNVSRKELSAAFKSAGDLLASVDVDVRWRECRVREDRDRVRDGCIDPLAPDELIVRIVRTPHGVQAIDELGFSYVDSVRRTGTLATVFADRVHALASQRDAGASVLLGRAMAHEVGHLLIGSTDHSQDGLMRQRWTVRSRLLDQGPQWQFSAADAAAIRSGAAGRAAERVMLALQTPPRSGAVSTR